jgi:O-antigen ligase
VALAVGRILSPSRALFIGGTIIGLSVAVLSTSGERTFERFVVDGASDSIRQSIYSLTERAIADAPLTGFGLGAFAPTFRLYRDASLPQEWEVDKAHNLYLELALELGIPFAMLLIGTLALLALKCAVGVVTRRRDQLYPALGIGVTVLLGLHNTIDFSLQIPAVAVTYALLLGLAFTQSFSTRPS